jgi:hypothetical protein
MVSLMAEVPEPLLLAMRAFIERHPNWDQYRLFQAALAGFLVQHWAGDRAITRCYLANLFPGSEGFQPSPVAVESAGVMNLPHASKLVVQASMDSRQAA